MRVYFLFLIIILFNGMLISQTEFSNFFNSVNGFNSCRFIKELPNNNYIFEYVKGRGNTEFFKVNSKGEIVKWTEIDNSIVLFSTFETDEFFFILVGAKHVSNSKIFSIKVNSNFDEFEVVDSMKIDGDRIQGHTPMIDDGKDNSYVVTTMILEPSIKFKNYILKLDDYGHFIDKIDINIDLPIERIARIPASERLFVTADQKYYICDSTFSIIADGQINFLENNSIISSGNTVFDFTSDTSVLFLGFNFKNSHNDLILSDGQIKNDDLLSLRILKSVYPSDTSTWDHTGIIRDSEQNIYFGFLKGFFQKGSFKHLSSNSIIIQKYSSELDFIWNFEYSHENAFFYLLDFQLVADGGILVYGFVENYYGNGIVNGYYLKLSPQGKIITKTTFPLPTQTEISVFPNPVKDYIILSSDYKKKADFTLYNSLGQKVFSKETMMDNTRIDLPNNLVKGAYLYQILDREGGLLNSGKMILK